MSDRSSAPSAIMPWRDNRGEFSWLRAVVFAAMWPPFLWMVWKYLSGDWDFPSPYVSLVYHSGLWATYLLLLALAVTPLRALLRFGRLIQVRRMIGLGALAYTVFHLFCWFALRDWDWSALWNETITRISLAVAAISLLGILALGFTSTDGAVRSMGSDLWRRMHRNVYWVTGLAILHYLMSPIAAYDRLPYMMLGAYIWLMAWRVMARRWRRGTDPVALVVLAVVSCLAVFLFQPLWIRLFHSERNDQPILDIMASNFDNLIWAHLGVPAMWWVLGVGLVVALVALLANLLAAPAEGSAQRRR